MKQDIDFSLAEFNLIYASVKCQQEAIQDLIRHNSMDNEDKVYFRDMMIQMQDILDKLDKLDFRPYN